MASADFSVRSRYPTELPERARRSAEAETPAPAPNEPVVDGSSLSRVAGEARPDALVWPTWGASLLLQAKESFGREDGGEERAAIRAMREADRCETTGEVGHDLPGDSPRHTHHDHGPHSQAGASLAEPRGGRDERPRGRITPHPRECPRTAVETVAGPVTTGGWRPQTGSS